MTNRDLQLFDFSLMFLSLGIFITEGDFLTMCDIVWMSPQTHVFVVC